ncbi:efflux RND transporter periplasmic adaptor subunit [Halobacillus sp. MO56]
MKKLIGPFILAVLLLGLISGCSNNDSEQAEEVERITPVETAVVEKGDLSIERKIVGRTKPANTSQIIPRSPGELVALNVEKGDRVKKGDAIGQVDAQNSQSQVDLQKNAVEQAGKQLENARISRRQAALGVENAKKQLDAAKQAQQAQAQQSKGQEQAAYQQYEQAKELADQTKKLADEGTIPEVLYQQAKSRADQAYAQYEQAKNQQAPSSAEIEQAEAQVDQAQSQLNQAEVGVEQAELQVEQAQVQLNQAQEQASNNTIYAGAAGEITSLEAQVGDMVSNQQPIGAIVALNPMTVEATVTSDQLNLFEEGQEIDVAINGVENPVTSTVDYVASVPNDTGLYPVEATIDNESEMIKPGTMATFLLPETVVADTFLVPTEAVVEEGGEAYIYEIVDEKAEKIAVTIVEAQSETTAIEGEITAGAEIVTTGQLTLTDGAKVSIIKEDA